MPKSSNLLAGVLFLLSGLVMLWKLPGYQRRVEAGEIKREASRPSFKTMRFAGFGIVLLGVLFLVGWYFSVF